MSKFMTIRQAAKESDCPISEGTLRAMVKRQEVPGFYAGSRFWIDFDALLKNLSERSLANVNPAAGVRE